MTPDNPVYEPVKTFLKTAIEDGAYQAGDQLPSETALMEQFGLSRHQVRHALRELELEGYIERSQGKGSFVAPEHRRPGATLRLNGKRTVAILVPHYRSLFVRQLLEGIMQHALNSGFQMVVHNVRYDDDSEYEFISDVATSGVAGMAAWIGFHQERTLDVLRELQTLRFPVVLLDRYFPGIELDYVGTDHEELGYRLTRALIERGHRHIGFVNIQDVPLTSVQERLAGYRRALDEAGIPLRPELELYLPAPLPSEGVRPSAAVMGLKERPTAFFAVNDLVALDLQKDLDVLGYAVGADIEIASVDDDHVSEDQGVPMIRVFQQGHAIGHRAAEILADRIANPQTPPQHVLVEAGPLVFDAPVEAAQS